MKLKKGADKILLPKDFGRLESIIILADRDKEIWIAISALGFRDLLMQTIGDVGTPRYCSVTRRNPMRRQITFDKKADKNYPVKIHYTPQLKEI